MTDPIADAAHTPWSTPPDGDTAKSPDNPNWPPKLDVPFSQVLSALNPLQHLPLVGKIYRATTGDDIPPVLRIAGAAMFGGPLGVIGAALGEFLAELVSMGPDTSRPAVPEGMSVTGSEAGVQPVSPGTGPADGYTTLATTTPQWLRASSAMELALVGDPRRGLPDFDQPTNPKQGVAAYQLAMTNGPGSGMG